MPLPVQNYFKFALTDGQYYISNAKLSHNGEFRQNENQKWFKINGEEHFTTEPPGFVWVGRMEILPLIWLTGIDQFIDSHGSFQIKLMSILQISVAPKGRELDESELMRWIGEDPLFPTSLLPSNYLRWEHISDNIAKAIANTSRTSVELIFHFKKHGEISFVEGQRYRTIGDKYVKEMWQGPYSNYVDKENMMIPLNIEVKWTGQKGDFSYAKFKIKNIKYNTKFMSHHL